MIENNTKSFEVPFIQDYALRMDTIVKRNIRSKIYSFFTTRLVYHSLFWMLFLVLLIALDTSNRGWLFTITIELINVLFYGVVVYFNLFYLIPNYLSEKRFVLYCLFLLLSVLLVTPIKMVIFYFLYTYVPEAQNTLVNNQILFFVSAFIFAGASTIVKIISDWVRYQRDRKELQTQTMQSELRFLKSQINPHFLFNTLNSLYALTLKKSDKAPEIVIKLSEMMRYMLYECNEKRVFLSKEVQYIRNYLDLEELRQGKDVDIDFLVKGQVGDQKIAPLMFIPFLENSFKHGLNNSIEQGFVHIELDVDRQGIHLSIENSKAETLPLQTHRRSGGIGLVNVRRRLNILYPNQYELKIADAPNTYKVDLRIDLDHKNTH
ncbi:MAG: histidine kinase [Bacteroidota bacterium]